MKQSCAFDENLAWEETSIDLSPASLAAAYLEFGQQLAAHESADDMFTTLTALAVDHVSGTKFAGVTQGRNGHFETVAPTDDIVRRVDAIQYELMSGPCVDAVLDDSVYVSVDLRNDPRWPEFGRRAADETGVVSMMSFRLFLEDDDTVAALNTYSTTPNSFDDDGPIVGLMLASHAALALSHTSARRTETRLQAALDTRGEIGIAMGILMREHHITRDEAFALLRIASQHSNRKLSEIARDVAETGVLVLPDRRRSK